MDVEFNKSFKNHYRDLYNAWFMQAPYGVKPKQTDVSVWVNESWEIIANTVSPNTWRKIGLPLQGDVVLAENVESEEVDANTMDVEVLGVDEDDNGSANGDLSDDCDDLVYGEDAAVNIA